MTDRHKRALAELAVTLAIVLAVLAASAACGWKVDDAETYRQDHPGRIHRGR